MKPVEAQIFFKIPDDEVQCYKLVIEDWEDAYKYFDSNGLDVERWHQALKNVTTSQDIYSSRERIFLLIEIPKVKNLYLFGGVHKHNEAIGEEIRHTITPNVQHSDLVGNIMIYAPTDRIKNRPESDYYLEHCLDEMFVIR